MKSLLVWAVLALFVFSSYLYFNKNNTNELFEPNLNGNHIGYSCDTNFDCYSAKCVDNLCVKGDVHFGDPCLYNDQCLSGLSCDRKLKMCVHGFGDDSSENEKIIGCNVVDLRSSSIEFGFEGSAVSYCDSLGYDYCSSAALYSKADLSNMGRFLDRILGSIQADCSTIDIICPLPLFYRISNLNVNCGIRDSSNNVFDGSVVCCNN